MSIPPTLHFIPFSGRDPNNLSGATRSALTLCGELAKRGRVSLVTFEDGHVAALARALGIDVVPVYAGDAPLPSAPRRLAETALAIRRAAARSGAELIHVHSAPGCKYAALAAASLRLPLVAHQRDIYAPDRFHRGLGLAARIIAISHWIHSTLPERLRRRASVVHNAVRVPEHAAPRTLTDRRTLRLGFAGRFNADKGPDLFVDAVARLLADGRDVEAHLWGVPTPPAGGQYAADIRRCLAELAEAHPGRIHTKDFQVDVEPFYRAMDVVVVPSRFAEPFGRVAIEAMAYGCVVVAAAHGGLPEIVEHDRNGVLFEPGDADSLGDRMATLVDDPDTLRRLSAAGFDHVRRQFTAETHADQVLGAYAYALA